MSMLGRTLSWILLLLVPMVLATPAGAEDEPASEKPATAEADENRSALWVIEGDVPTFLYGTVHVPDARVLKLPALVEKAIQASDVLVSEMPMDMASQMKAQRAALLPPGDNLEKCLGPELYKRVTALLPKSLPPMIYRQFSPFSVMALLELGRYMESMIKGKVPLDMALYRRFQKAKKTLDAIESVDDQLAVINAFTREEQVEMLRATVAKHERELEDGSDSMEEMLGWYLAGKYERILHQMEADLTGSETLNEKAKRVMLTDRNVKMVDTLAKKLEADPSVVRFVAIGAGHYPGKRGVLALLKEKGYSVRRLEPGDALPAKQEPAAATK